VETTHLNFNNQKNASFLKAISSFVGDNYFISCFMCAESSKLFATTPPAGRANFSVLQDMFRADKSRSGLLFLSRIDFRRNQGFLTQLTACVMLDSAMNTVAPIEWKASFRADDRIYVTDGGILLDQRIAFADDPLPKNGNAKQYGAFKRYWSIPAAKPPFRFDALSLRQGGDYDGPDKLILNRKYISFLLRRVPEELLRFRMTGGNEDPVQVYREEDHVGILMGIRDLPDFGPELIALADSGHVSAQMRLGYTYAFSKTVRTDYKEAVKWFSRAAEQNNPKAFCYLGRFFFSGLGVKRDWTKSLIFFERAIGLGCNEAISLRAKLIRRMPSEQYEMVAAQIVSQMVRHNALGTETGS
jgi:hypothetical protein